MGKRKSAPTAPLFDQHFEEPDCRNECPPPSPSSLKQGPREIPLASKPTTEQWARRYALDESEHKVLALSDLHINRIYHPRRGGHKYTNFGNGRAEAFFNLLSQVDTLVSVGDEFDNHYWKDDLDAQEPLDFGGSEQEWIHENDAQRLCHRYDPIAFKRHILTTYPHLRYVTLIGNHEGYSASDDHSYMQELQKLMTEFPNFSVADIYENGNLLLFHGHQHIEYVNEDERGGRHYVRYYRDIIPREGFGESRPAKPICAALKEREKSAYAITQTSTVQDFIHRKAADIIDGSGPRFGGADLYVGIGHRHYAQNTTVTLPLSGQPEDGPAVRVHVSDCGCAIGTKSMRPVVYHLNDGAVTSQQPIRLLNFTDISQRGVIVRASPPARCR